MVDFLKIKNYFLDCFNKFGVTPMGLNWNSIEAQEIRFEQVSKVINYTEPYSIIDFGCGYGSLINYLKLKGHTFTYTGYDIVDEMILKGRELHQFDNQCTFTHKEEILTKSDYVVESGIFNVKQSITDREWTEYIISLLNKMNSLAKVGMACNFLTKYSDPEFKRSDLYYADPCFIFDYCKNNFSRNVALLHDYDLYDFTIIVRK